MRYHRNFHLARQEMLPYTLGYFKFHGKQDTVNAILENNDCIVLMPTSGGKTEYYEVLGIILPRFTIVVTPVIAYTWSLSWQTCGIIKLPSKVF